MAFDNEFHLVQEVKILNLLESGDTIFLKTNNSSGTQTVLNHLKHSKSNFVSAIENHGDERMWLDVNSSNLLPKIKGDVSKCFAEVVSQLHAIDQLTPELLLGAGDQTKEIAENFIHTSTLSGVVQPRVVTAPASGVSYIVFSH